MVGIAVARRQLLAVRGGELPRGAGRDQDLEPGIESEQVRHYPAGLLLVEHLDEDGIEVLGMQVVLPPGVAFEEGEEVGVHVVVRP